MEKIVYIAPVFFLYVIGFFFPRIFQFRKRTFYSLFFHQNFELLGPEIVANFWMLVIIYTIPNFFSQKNIRTIFGISSCKKYSHK